MLTESDARWLRRLLDDEGLRFRRARNDDDDYLQARADGSIDAIARVMFHFGVVPTDEAMNALVEQAKGVDED